MAWDLALGPTQDFIYGPNNDYLAITGINVIEQRIRTRLKIHRGTWIYDTDGTLGSRIDSVIGETYEKASSDVVMYVHEALNGMDDISVTKVTTKPLNNEKSMLLVVGFTLNPDTSQSNFAPPDEFVFTTEIQFQL